METWSRYNYILDSNKLGKFIFNSRTNSFTKIGNNIFEILNKNANDFYLLNKDIKDKFKELKIIVEEKEDDDYYYNKKFYKYLNSFSQNSLLLTIATTTECNFRCPYCFEREVLKATLTKKEEDAIIKFINNNSAKSVSITWYGGEPLLNFKSIKAITEILKNEYNGKKIVYSMVTNGYLLTPQVVDFLKNFRFEYIQVTLDGIKEINDKTRILANGKGSFDVIIKNIEYARSAMPECLFKIRANTDKNNINLYPKLYEFLREKFHESKNIHIYHSFITDYNNNLANCVATSDTHIYNKMLAETENIIDFDTYPEFSIGGCTADSLNGFVIDPKGQICKCWLEVGKPDKVVGSIMDNNSGKFNYNLLSQYMVNSDMYNNQKCKDCFLFPCCPGGCSYQRIEHGHEKACPYTLEEIKTYLELNYAKLKEHQHEM